MKRINIILSLSLIMSASFFIEAFANIKTITEVSFKVHHELEAGLYIENLAIDTDSATGSDVNIYSKSKQYSLRVVKRSNSDKQRIGIGDKIRLNVAAYPKDGSDGYQFRGSYSTENVKVTGAEVISVERVGKRLETLIELAPVKGTYAKPIDVELIDNQNLIGKGKWKAPEDSSSYYDIVLYNGTKEIFSVNEYQGETFNFYPYMTSEGIYKYKVRTVPHTEAQKKVGKKSEWAVSDEYYIDKNHVSDGSGRENISSQNFGQVGWVQEGVYWYYRFPNGAVKTNGWECINDKWYLFSNSGIMLTGWQKYNDKTYYLNPEGDMKTGWLYNSNKWYYLNADDEEKKGQLVKNTWIRVPENKTYYMNDDGAMAEGWTQIGDKWYYFYPSSGQMAYNTRIDTFYLDADGVWIKNNSK